MIRALVAAIARVRRAVPPPRIIGVTRRPAGWLVVGRRRLESVVAWGQLEDGQVVGLIAARRGLRPAAGWRFQGFLPPLAHSSRDVQPSPPAVSIPVADLVEAIGDVSDWWTVRALAEIYGRLKLAAENEWASEALRAFVTDPERFMRRHLELLVEHGRAADLDDDWRAGLASINTHAAAAAEENRP